ncbi:hypothetical protein PUNSTDRAFT_76587 [Punctularia strigosozonata HHB-11173 SS5]|uniref:BTB domain-containing protein n=1 Tax=Punctularia strigosozonata (strain HHB-11173) TaxID=741275 RepID=R7S222_PUNST|nr:uncharacterized protein PUNSTDRAFT_76587 [Punctularia strigosozonata HHB-11173 SS5]EIN04233.1 hypothetical protein PUNSTDRAFT_76587 [Punctularia strigosozonata HHB-11173 SS5]
MDPALPGGDEDGQPCIELTPCTELWYEDGSIVLAAEGVGFKVYQMLVAQNSTIFADMLAISTPQANIDSRYGCPLVHMPDPADHLRSLLLAIHDARYAHRRIDNAPCAEVIGIVSLATKYDIPHLRIRAAKRLAMWYPDSLKAWIAVRRESVSLSPTDNRDVMNVARQCNLTSLLPVIMFALCDRPIAEIIDASLCPQDLLLIMQGRLELLSMQRLLPYRWLYRGNETCVTPSICNRLKESHSHTLENNPWRQRVWTFFNPFVWANVEKSGMCKQCVADGIQTGETGRQHAWNELPAIFGLPPWNQLRRKP